MFDEPDNGVTIGNDHNGIRLSCRGEIHECGCPTLIEVRAGPFAGTVLDHTVGDYATFLEQLESLYGQLSGTASLGSREGFSLVLKGHRGRVDAAAVIVGEQVPSSRLSFEFSLDQSYLPPIMRALRREFASSIRGRTS